MSGLPREMRHDVGPPADDTHRGRVALSASAAELGLTLAAAGFFLPIDSSEPSTLRDGLRGDCRKGIAIAGERNALTDPVAALALSRLSPESAVEERRRERVES